MATKRATKKPPTNAKPEDAPAEKSEQWRLPFLQNPAEYARVAEVQRTLARRLADMIEQGEPITEEHERKFVAVIVRAWADNLPAKPKGKQGPPPKFCPGSEAMSYAAHRWKGMAHGEALAEIADRVGVSEQAVAKGIKNHRAAAFAFMGIPDPGNQKK